MKFIVFYRFDSDPEVLEYLGRTFCKNVGRFKINEMLTFAVNFSHMLSPQTKEIYTVICTDLVFRLSNEYVPYHRDLLINA